MGLAVIDVNLLSLSCRFQKPQNIPQLTKTERVNRAEPNSVFKFEIALSTSGSKMWLTTPIIAQVGAAEPHYMSMEP